MTVRIEVEHFPSGDRQTVTVDLALATPEVRRLVDDTIADLAAELGLHPETVACGMVAELVQRHHDTAAYYRECARRGVLAL